MQPIAWIIACFIIAVLLTSRFYWKARFKQADAGFRRMCNRYNEVVEERDRWKKQSHENKELAMRDVLEAEFIEVE